MKLNRNSNYAKESGSGWLVFISLLIILSIVLFGARHKIKDGLHEILAYNKTDIEEIVAGYIKNNPKALIESVEAWRKSQEEEYLKHVREKLKETKDDLANNKDEMSPLIGNKNGDLVVATFMDYRCGYCKRSHKELLEFVKRDPNVKVYIKELPILGPQSQELAKLALAVHFIDSSKFLAVHNALMDANQYDDKTLDTIFAQNGLDAKKVREQSKDAKIQKAIDLNRQLAAEVGVRGTPAYIFDEQLIGSGLDANSMVVKAEEIRKSRKGN